MVDYDALDSGIREVVRLLNAHGFVTTDSGDGISKPLDWYESGDALPFPHVAANADRATMFSEADRMAMVLGPEWTVEATYGTRDGICSLFARPLDPREKKP